jgi:VCBS repeat-containing protein
MGRGNWWSRLQSTLVGRPDRTRHGEDPRSSLYPDFYVTALEVRRVLNASPVISPQTFAVPDNASAGDVVASVVASDPDPGDSLSFAITGGNVGEAFAIHPTTGTITVADPSALATETSFGLIVQVTDPVGATASTVITIEVQPSTAGNDPPVINHQRFVVPVGSPNDTEIGQLLASDPDADDTLTFSITAGNEEGAFAVDPDTGILTVADAEKIATPQTWTLTVRVDDSGDASDTATIQIRVNAPPTALNLSSTTVPENEPGAVVGSISVADPNPDDQFTFALGDSRFEIVGGELKLKASESLDFEDEATIELQIMVTDQGGASYQQLFVIEVLDRNDPPTDITLSNQVVPTKIDGAIVGVVLVEDEDDPATPFGSHTFLVMEGAAGSEDPSTRFYVDVDQQLRLFSDVSLSKQDGPTITLRIRATDNPSGEPRFSITRTFTLDVEETNSAPTEILLSNNTVSENAPGAVVGVVTVIDEDDPSTPFGQHTFLVMEGPGMSPTPSTRFFVDANQQLRLFDGVQLSFETEPTVTLRIRATDNPGGNPRLSVTETFTIFVEDMNDPPTDITLSNNTVEENASGAVIGTITVADVDDPETPLGTHTFEVFEGPVGDDTTSSRFHVDEDLQLRLLPGVALDHETEPSVTLRIRATDNPGGIPRLSVTRTFVIVVLDANDPPTDITLGNHTVEENAPGAVIGTVTVEDEDDPNTPFGTHTFEVFEGPEGDDTISSRFFVDNDRQLRLLPGVSLNYEVEPSVTVRIRATDNPGGEPRFSITRTFTIEVIDVNDPPVAFDKQFTTSQSPPLAGNALVGGPGDAQDFDEDNDPLTVVEVNGSEPAFGEPFALPSGATLTMLADGDFLYDPSTSPAVLQLQEGEIFDDSFTYTISDGRGGFATATVRITVSGVNNPPTVNPTAMASGVEDTPRQFTFDELFTVIGGNDPDSDVEFLRILVTDVQNGTLQLSGTADGGPDTQFTFFPDLNFNGDLRFQYQLEDRIDPENILVSNIGDGTLVIAPVNDPPELNIPEIRMIEDVTFESIAVLRDNFFDVETPPDEAIFEVLGQSFGIEQAVVTEAGALRIVPLANFNGSAWIVVQATDTGDGDDPALSVTQTVDIWITPVNDPPTAVTDEFTTQEDTPVPLSGNVLANDFDIDTDPTLNLGLLALDGVTPENLEALFGIDPNSAQLISPGVPLGGGWVRLNSGGHVLFQSNGDFTYLPAPDFFGMETFQYSIRDQQGAVGTGTVSILVTPVNDPPFFDPLPPIELDPLNPQRVPITNAVVGPPNEAMANPWFPNAEFPAPLPQSLTITAVSSNPSFLPDPTITQDPNNPTTFWINFPVLPFRTETVVLTITARDDGGTDPGEDTFQRTVEVRVIVGIVPASSQQFERRAPATFPVLEAVPVFPEPPATPQLPTAALQETAASSQGAARAEREVVVYLISRDGPEGLTEKEVLRLEPSVLKDLKWLFANLPDDRFRIYLHMEDGTRRLVVDVYVREGRAYDPGDAMRELIRLPAENDPEDNPVPEEGDTNTPDGAGGDSPEAGAPLPALERPLPELHPATSHHEQAASAERLFASGAADPSMGPTSGQNGTSARWAAVAAGVAALGTRRQHRQALLDALAAGSERPLHRFTARLRPPVQ